MHLYTRSTYRPIQAYISEIYLSSAMVQNNEHRFLKKRKLKPIQIQRCDVILQKVNRIVLQF